MGPAKIWSLQEIGALQQGMAEGLTYKQVAVRVGRSETACKSKARELRLASSSQPWLGETTEQRQARKAATKAAALGRSRERDRVRRRERGIKPKGGRDHPWSAELPPKEKPRAHAGIDWWTGEPLPNTLDYWVRSAVRGHRGVVLDATKTREVARLLGIPTVAEPVEDQSAHGTVADAEMAAGPNVVDTDLAALKGTGWSLTDDGGDLSEGDLDPDE